MIDIPDFCILIDSREQKKYTFKKISPKPKTEIICLKTGDYSLAGFQHTDIIIERKELSDIFQSVGKGRIRFEKELIRMASYNYPAIVIESSLSAMFTNPPARSKMSSKAVFRSLIAFSIRYNVHVWNAWSRESAEKITYILLKRYYDDFVKGKIGGK